MARYRCPLWGLLAIASVCLLSFGAIRQEPQPQSLRDLARANGGKVTLAVIANGPVGSIAYLADTADLIVQGRVAHIESRLSRDESRIRTYVTLTATQFLSDKLKITQRATPGAIPGLVFFYPGGTVRSNGLEMTYGVTVVDPPLQVGDEVIVFLAKGDGEDTAAYRVEYNEFGILRVQGEKFLAANETVQKRRPLPTDKVTDIQRTIRERVAAQSRR